MDCMRVSMIASWSSEVIRSIRWPAISAPAVIFRTHGLKQLVTAEHQFTCQGHELVQQADVNPQAGFGFGFLCQLTSDCDRRR
jgi:hypothetical protein